MSEKNHQVLLFRYSLHMHRSSYWSAVCKPLTCPHSSLNVQSMKFRFIQYHMCWIQMGNFDAILQICGKLMKSSLFLTKDFSTQKKTTDLVIVCSTSSNTGEQKSLQHDLYTRNFDLLLEELNNIPIFPSLIILRLSHCFCIFRVPFISFIKHMFSTED